jgi:glycerophosphoryl diester phosphodiesterase
MTAADWLIRPIAHRGLHDSSQGVIENTASAFQAAIDAGYAIECDLQEAGDGEPMVFHDATLDRLTTASGSIGALPAAKLQAVPFKQTGDRMQTLNELLEQVGARVPLVIEVKSRWDARGPFEKRIGGILAAYGGPAAVMSFDPNSVRAFKAQHPKLVRGMLGTRFEKDDHWGHLSAARRFVLRNLLEGFTLRPDFIAYDIKALPALAPMVARTLAGLPLLTWTVRTQAQRHTAERWADAVIFEGFRP